MPSKPAIEADAKVEGEIHTDSLAVGLFSDGVHPVYRAKAEILNNAMQEIGMGRYQWELFIVTGFGYWGSIANLILRSVVNEFGFRGPFLKLSQSIGLFVGAVFWGLASDVWGRKISFNISLLFHAIFTLLAGASPNYIALCSFAAIWSVGIGGNIPVDSAIFLEFVPPSHQYLVTVMSIWSAVYTLLESLVAWPFITNFSCTLVKTAGSHGCPRSSNQGWRYLLFTMGGFMAVLWAIRFFLFKLHESPKYLMGCGRDEDAVAVIHQVAKHNGTTSSFTLEHLSWVGSLSYEENKAPDSDTTAKGAFTRNLAKFDGAHIKSLFATRKLAYSTTMLIILWGLIGVALPLYSSFLTYYLATRGVHFGDGSLYITYRNQVILSAIGIPGSLLAGWMVELPRLGRRGTLAVSIVLTGIFILASTTARTSNALLGWNCAYSFTSNIMNGVLHAVTPELLLTKDRGTGNALTSAANRIFGIMAPIIALYADINTSVPVFISGAIFIFAGLIAILLPFESRGRASF